MIDDRVNGIMMKFHELYIVKSAIDRMGACELRSNRYYDQAMVMVIVPAIRPSRPLSMIENSIAMVR